MRNLKLNDVRSYSIGHPVKFLKCINTPDIECQKEFLIDSNLNLVVKSGSKVIQDIDLDLVSKKRSIEAILYDSFRKEIVCGLDNGDFIVVTVDQDKSKNVEFVEGSGEGIKAAQFSPDEELLVVINDKCEMILMSSVSCEIARIPLADEQFGEKEFINVGWGKKETQFHGSEGKAAAKQKIEDIKVEVMNTDTNVQIAWRGDGQLFAVSYYLGDYRKFKVFDRDGALQYTSEKQPGLESNLSWRPSGNLIATTQRLPNKYVVAFFEKNGLKHGEFTLPFNELTIVTKLVWNSDSDVLAVLCFNQETETKTILLYTMNNYHWYLKQTLHFSKEQNIINVLWDGGINLANSKILHVFLDDGQHLTYSWCWNVDHSKGKTENDNAVVAVIDGNKILLTGLRQTVVPPPYAALELKLSENVLHICFAPGGADKACNNFFAVTSSKVLFYELVTTLPLNYKLIKSIDLTQTDYPLQRYIWKWVSSEKIIAIAESNGEYQIEEYSGSKDVNTRPVNSVMNCCSNPMVDNGVIFQTSAGSYLSYSFGEDVEPLPIKSSTPCDIFDAAVIDEKLYLFGLSMRFRLYINGIEYASNINSMFVHSNFLLLTSLQHKLIITELTTEGLEYLKHYTKDPKTGVSVRNLERGSRLVVAVPCDSRTILQMPRGNLETLQPRALSLYILGKYLDACKYNLAFDLMRKQRINLNLIVDHNPQKFLSNVSEFVEQISNNTWLVQFIADLEELDVTLTMYSSSYASRSNKRVRYDKVNLVCTALLIEFRKDLEAGRMLPILTTYLKRSEEESLETALRIVKDIKEQEKNGARPLVSSDEAFKFIFYMIDVSTVFDIALGMYDFDLVLLVASKSQKDPKEYVPMLNEFKEMEENYCKFSINKHLKRFTKALKYLAKCESKESELRPFVKHHGLFKEAMELLDSNTKVYKDICEDFALNLKLNKNYYEAGIVYRRGGHIDKAIDCFKNVCWETTLTLAVGKSEDQYRNICLYLVERLADKRNHAAAITILEHHLKDLTSCFEYALSNGLYETAIRVCHLEGVGEACTESEILKTIQSDHGNVLHTIKTNLETFDKQQDRLRVVRETKIKNKENEEMNFGDQDCDLYSDAGSTVASNSSKSSSHTFRSSKNRRKHGRKLISLKEGSQYEERALVWALHSLVKASYGLRDQVSSICRGLVWFGRDQEAFKLQFTLDQLLSRMKEKRKKIWCEEFQMEALEEAIVTRDIIEKTSIIPQNDASLEPYLRIPPVISESTWKLSGLHSTH